MLFVTSDSPILTSIEVRMSEAADVTIILKVTVLILDVVIHSALMCRSYLYTQKISRALQRRIAQLVQTLTTTLGRPSKTMIPYICGPSFFLID